MIKRLKIKNFQVHKEKEVTFTKGVNVIIGETNKGKSALIRALFLLFENKPRGADKIFHRRSSKLPMVIELEDANGNIISKKRKKYYLNGVEYKAFNNDVPLPIKELFPLQDINWHRQLDPHYLILSTPGNAAKILGTYTGLDEQEKIVKEIKDRLSESKAEIKRLNLNNEEERNKIKQLRPVVRNLIIARFIKSKQDQLEENLEKGEALQEILLKINSIDDKKTKFDISKGIERLNEILRKISELEKNEDTTKNLFDILQRLKDDDAIDSASLNQFIKTANEIINQINTLAENKSLLLSVQTTIEEIKLLENKINSFTMDIFLKEKEFKGLLKELKYCPLCNSKFI